MVKFHIKKTLNPSQNELNALTSGLSENARFHKGLDPIQSFALIVYNAQTQQIGGLSANTYYGCLYIDQIFIDPNFRGLGLGKELIKQAEIQGRSLDCHFATLCTMDFEAKPFYEKLGYHVEFVRTGYAKKCSMYFMRKNLI